MDIAKIKDEFTSKFEEQLVDLKLTHTIDLIDYNSKLNPLDEITFSYHNNSNNCSYHKHQCDEYLIDNTKRWTSVLDELRKEKKITEEFEILLNNLSLEGVVNQNF